MEQTETHTATGTPTKNPSGSESAVTAYIENLSPDLFLIGAAFSIGASLVLRVLNRQHDAQFVGQWAPTLLIAGLYTKRRSRFLQGKSGGEDEYRSTERYVM